MLPRRQLTRLAAPRAARVTRSQQLRFQSTTTTSSSSSQGSSTAATLATGLAGGLAGAALFYTAYSFTPAGRAASSVNFTVKEAAKKYEQAAQEFQKNTPSADEAVGLIKQHAYSYVSWVPGGREYVDVFFKDWETVRKEHKDEADQIVQDTYKELQKISRAGLSLETGSKFLEVLTEFSKKIASLTADAFTDVIDNHPQIKEKFGGSIDQLKSMGDKYGPEAKKKVDETWKEVTGLFAGGFTIANADKARKLVEKKIEEVKQFGDEAWNKALEEAKPILDKNPKAKELIEQNADALKQGNIKELFDNARKAVDSGNIDDLKKYIESTVGKSGGEFKELYDKVRSSVESGDYKDLEKYVKSAAEKTKK